ncbi:acylglycerol kinase, mitochondrial-like [Patiria miniata]|uniref:Acylglycerol kinase C-terminal domain-containing protein n=1 Tax=Patiria miniata TaxID=46514 RepID=A0A913ZZS4_PATMI|nr:acylglycerol kinase, mitochondrial-like [Patiria miniata]
MIWRSSPKEESKELGANADDETTEPEEEIEWTEDDLVTTELVVATGNTDEVKMSPRALRVQTGPAQLSRTGFVREGWRRASPSQDAASDDYKTQTAEVGEIKITPALKEGEEAWYSVDNERLEAQPITVQILPRKLQFFTDRQDRDTLIGGTQKT